MTRAQAIVTSVIGAIVAWLAACAGWALAVAYPPCCPGAQRGCNVQSGALGIQYCTRSGFGWEACESFPGPGGAYPQALWRGKVPE